VPFTGTPEKVSVLVDSVTVVPVPLKATVCGLPLALSVMLKLPLTVLVPAGV
jgi:hypothetical protein